ncbi:50S ribosomal protein L11 methyltransferase [Methanobrevibacter arboriphilus]|uniref:50S ribosomal protein L11 methyltransferase n=1 Tax=Methanobrevibacter arboriphilus TaxID=39441 RepID=UPI000AB97468|nr:50S ribosomal protein L11 methyltransferase [Methanobrevibacter arboriphilus]
MITINPFLIMKIIKLKTIIKKISTVFDLGCGSGVLSYFASKYSKRVLAIDNDDKSIQCAKKNF